LSLLDEIIKQCQAHYKGKFTVFMRIMQAFSPYLHAPVRDILLFVPFVPFVLVRGEFFPDPYSLIPL